MPSSETDSDSEPVVPGADAVSSLTAFAHLSSTRLPDSNDQSTVSWAIDTLATLDFRLVRKDAALHDLIQSCASTILASFDAVLQQRLATDISYCFIPDMASILRPSFLHLLFQYRRLFLVIATRDVKPNSAPPAIVCWVDVVLAKLGDVVALVAAGFDGDHPDYALPESLNSKREEDNLRAAIQLPDNWDMLPSVLLSERVSAAAKRLSIRLLLGKHILGPALSGQVGADATIHQLLPTLVELVKQGAARVDELRSASWPHLQHLLLQARFTSAMILSLFAAADIVQDSGVNLERATAFRPQTVAAVMTLLRFVLSDTGYTSQTNVLNPPDHLDAPTSVIVRWGVVPQWTWNVWFEYRCLHADTIMHLTTTYIRHHNGTFATLWDISDSVSANSTSSDPAAMASVIIDFIFRFISVLSAGAHSRQLPKGMVNALHGSCRLISQWMNRNTCGIQRSKECCKAMIILFGYLSQNEQHFDLDELVIECLVLAKGQCIREAWKAATEDNNFGFIEALGQSLIQTKMSLSQDDVPESAENCAGQLIQFFVVVMSSGVQPVNLDTLIDFMEAVGERVLETRLKNREFLCENWLLCLAMANLSDVGWSFNKAILAGDEEAIWHLGMCSGGANLFLTSAFSLYITSALVCVDSLTYLEGLEHLSDVVLLICSRHCSPEEEPLGLLVLPTICDALAHLLQHVDDGDGAPPCENTRMSALCGVLRSIWNGECENSTYGALLRRRLGLSTAWREEGLGAPRYELVCCRGRLLYVVRDT